MTPYYNKLEAKKIILKTFVKDMIFAVISFFFLRP